MTSFKVVVYNVGRRIARSFNHVEPYGIIGINTFTKKVHIEPVKGKIGKDDWKPGLQNIIDKLGNPEVIYTDPDASLDSNAMKEWFVQNKIRNVITPRER